MKDQTAPPAAPQAGPADPANPADPKGLYRELHIRLQRDAAKDEANLNPLLDCLRENPGPCTVYIHVPVREGERVVRTGTQLTASPARLETFSRCAAVAEVWGR